MPVKKKPTAVKSEKTAEFDTNARIRELEARVDELKQKLAIRNELYRSLQDQNQKLMDSASVKQHADNGTRYTKGHNCF